MRSHVAIPCHGSTDSCEDHADASSDESVTHRAVRSQPGGYVATYDAEDHAIDSRKEQQPTGSVLVESWKNAELARARL